MHISTLVLMTIIGFHIGKSRRWENNAYKFWDLLFADTIGRVIYTDTLFRGLSIQI